VERYKLLGIDQILAKLIQAEGETLCSEVHKVINSIQNKEELLEQWMESVLLTVYGKGGETD
jgi:hypothetical protein